MNWLLSLGVVFAVLLCTFDQAKSNTRCEFPGHPRNGHLTGDWINRLDGTILGLTCDPGYLLKGVLEIVCKNGKWSGKLGRCEVVKCQPPKQSSLSIAYPPSCFTAPSPYGTLCRLYCPPGYVGGGGALYCEIDGQWDGHNIVCKDYMPPNLKCPSNPLIVQSDPGKSTAKVRLPAPSYTDNSLAHGGKLTFSATLDGKPVSVKQDVELSIGDDHHQVTYAATDEAGNKRKCHFIYRVDDKEPPKVHGCPKDITVTMDDNKQMVQVFWKEPTATDNSGVDVKVYPSHRNGAVFYEGTQKVEYQFSDNADNRVTCEFYVTVKRPCLDHTGLLPVTLIKPDIVLPDPSNACSFVAANLRKCNDSLLPQLPWKEICRKTCKVC